jgi:SAM-dependent methyltransferase
MFDERPALVGWGRRAAARSGVELGDATRVLEAAAGLGMLADPPDAEMGHHITRYVMYRRIRDFFDADLRTGRVLEVSGTAGAIHAMFNPERIEYVATEYPPVDVHELPFADASFDFAICDQVIEHIRSPRTAVAELHRVLRPAGWLLIATAFLDPIHTRPETVHDYWRFTPEGLGELLGEFGNVYQCEGWGNREALAVVLFGGPQKYLPVEGHPYLERVASYNEAAYPLSVWAIAQKAPVGGGPREPR